MSSTDAAGGGDGPPPGEVAAVDAARPIFVVGCGHSGTTLLAAMLDSHPAIHCFPGESGVFLAPALRPAFPVLVRLAAEARRLGKPRIAEKTPRHVHHLDRILSLLPSSRALLVLRDGRDVAASLTRRGVPLRAGAARWVADNAAALGALGRWPDRVTTLRYEALVTDPAAALTAGLEALGEAFDPGMLRFHEGHRSWFDAAPRPGNEGHARHLARRNAQMNQPLFDGRGEWRHLPPADRRALEDALGPMLARLGYA